MAKYIDYNDPSVKDVRKIWNGIKNRCLNPRNPAYKYYGGRGIEICDRWLHFENFYKDMGPRPDGYSIERIDVNGHYIPYNCKWIPKKEQFHNRRNSIRKRGPLGIAMTISQWSKALNLSYSFIHYRISKGYTISKIINEQGLSHLPIVIDRKIAKAFCKATDPRKSKCE